MERLTNMTDRPQSLQVKNLYGRGYTVKVVQPGKTIQFSDEEFEKIDDVDPDIWLIVDYPNRKCHKPKKVKKNKCHRKPKKKNDSVAINSFNNSFIIGVDGISEIVVQVAPGTYTRAELAIAVSAAMEATYIDAGAFGDVCPFSCSYNATSKQYIFTLDTVLFPDCTMFLNFLIASSIYVELGYNLTTKYINYVTYTGGVTGISASASVALTTANNHFVFNYRLNNTSGNPVYWNAIDIYVPAGSYTRENLAIALNNAIFNSLNNFGGPAYYYDPTVFTAFVYDTVATQYKFNVPYFAQDEGEMPGNRWEVSLTFSCTNPIGPVLGFNIVNATYEVLIAGSYGYLGYPINGGVAPVLEIINSTYGGAYLDFLAVVEKMSQGMGGNAFYQYPIQTFIPNGIYTLVEIANVFNFIHNRDTENQPKVSCTYDSTAHTFTFATVPECDIYVDAISVTFSLDFTSEIANYYTETAELFGFSPEIYTGALTYTGEAVLRPVAPVKNQVFVCPKLRIPIFHDGEEYCDMNGYIV